MTRSRRSSCSRNHAKRQRSEGVTRQAIGFALGTMLLVCAGLYDALCVLFLKPVKALSVIKRDHSIPGAAWARPSTPCRWRG